MDYFEVFGLPRTLGLDLQALEKKFHELSRRYHPDYFSTASSAESVSSTPVCAFAISPNAQ